MEGIGGKPAWLVWAYQTKPKQNAVNFTSRAWIFILEGLLTVVAGVASFFIIQDFPDNARFLTERERAFVIHRLQADDQFSAGGEELRWKYIFKSILDWKTWVGSEWRVLSDRSMDSKQRH